MHFVFLDNVRCRKYVSYIKNLELECPVIVAIIWLQSVFSLIAFVQWQIVLQINRKRMDDVDRGLRLQRLLARWKSQSDVTVHHYFQYSRRDGGNGGNGAADLDREVTPRFEYGSPEWHRFCDSVINSRFHNDQAVDFVRNMERYRVLVNSLFRPDEVVTERERRVRILEALFGLLVLLLHSASNHGTVTFDDIDIINCQLSMNQGRMVSHSHIQDSEFMLSWCIFLYNININYWNYII